MLRTSSPVVLQAKEGFVTVKRGSAAELLSIVTVPQDFAAEQLSTMTVP